jgi:hypothetical protein
MSYNHGGERGPVILPVFKAGDSALREPSGGFDSHTLPPSPLFMLWLAFTRALHVRAVLDIAPGPSWSYDSGSQASYVAAISFLFQKAYFASRDTGPRLGLLGLRSAR